MTDPGRRPPHNRLRTAVIAAGVTALLLVLESLQVHAGYESYFRHLLIAYSGPALWVRISGWLVIAGLQAAFFWILLLASWPVRAAGLALFAAITAFEYGYAGAMDLLPNATFLHSVLTSVKYWAPEVGANLRWAAAGPILLVAAALWLVPAPRAARAGRRLAVWALLTVGVHSTYALVPLRTGELGVLRGGAAEVLPYLVTPTVMQTFVRSVTLYAWADANRAISGDRRRDLTYVSPVPPTGHIVLIIDESVSAARLSVNGYARPTTPWLDTVAAHGHLANWGEAASVAPDSAPSVAALLTGVQTLPDRAKTALHEPTVFQYAKAMGYHTRLYDGQIDRPLRFGFRFRDRRFIDDFRGIAEFGSDYDSDFRIAAAVREALTGSEPQFIVVLKVGNHSPYGLNYPPGARHWLGAYGAASDDLNGETADAYDNALRYNVDRFFQGLLTEEGTLPGTVVIYTSDHGRRGRSTRVRHAVPLMMFGDARPAVDTGYAASHLNIFPTLLDLMRVPLEVRPPVLARSLLTARSHDHDPRPVIDGDLFGQESFRLADFNTLPR